MFKSYLNNIILEGGKVAVNNVTASPIELKNIAPTMEHIKKVFLKKHLNLDDGDYTTKMGSAGKKPISGDIDMAIDVNKMMKKNPELNKRLEDLKLGQMKKGKWDKMTKEQRDKYLELEIEPKIYNLMIDYMIEGLNKAGIMNKPGKGRRVAFALIQQYDEKNKPIEGKYVQSDFILSKDLTWSEWANYVEAGGLKGLYRNSIFDSILAVLDRKKPNDYETIDVEFNRHFGMMRMNRSFMGKTGKVKNPIFKERKELTASPNAAVKMIFGGKFKGSDVMTWKQAFDILVNSPDFRDGKVSNEGRIKILEYIKGDISHKTKPDGSAYPVPPEVDEAITKLKKN